LERVTQSLDGNRSSFRNTVFFKKTMDDGQNPKA
jgi:hypothetical protein